MTSRAGKPDTAADIRLREIITSKSSFLMVAGAGSGKTTSLVKALTHIMSTQGKKMKMQGQKVACITYTEIARDEIWKDLGEDPLVLVSTIHSFLWTIIKPFRENIRTWITKRLEEKISVAQAKIDNPRTRDSTKISSREDIDYYNTQLAGLSEVPNFNYGTGSDYLKGVLGHDDIIKLGPDLIREFPLLKEIIARTYPYIFVDESQDTLKTVVEALTSIQVEAQDSICLGFFGDQMQKIYATGIGIVERQPSWEIVEKPENFRCPPAILEVINNIRRGGDSLQQTTGLEWERNGKARMFIAPLSDNRTETLARIRGILAEEHDDPKWLSDNKLDGVRVLVIVHRMAAIRLGFGNIYSALNDNGGSIGLKEGLMEGTGWLLTPFIRYLLPLAKASMEGRDFDVISLLKNDSPLFESEALKAANTATLLSDMATAVSRLVTMLADTSTSTIEELIHMCADTGLLRIDPRLQRHLDTDRNGADEVEGGTPQDAPSIIAFLECRCREFWGFQSYIQDESPFATQHGIKGSEFERVLTILDDDEGSYNLYSYDKYFGIQTLSPTDIANIAEEKDSVLDRTRRLFYVSCSRATDELAVVLFADDVAFAREKVLESGIFPVAQITSL